MCEDGNYKCMSVTDYSKHQMEDIITNDWDLCDISSEVITYNEVVYQKHDEDSKILAKAFLWHECLHVAPEYKLDKTLV